MDYSDAYQSVSVDRLFGVVVGVVLAWWVLDTIWYLITGSSPNQGGKNRLPKRDD